MKKIVLVSAMLASLSAVTHAEGIIGNQFSIDAGYPYYSDQPDYTGYSFNAGLDYFVSDNVYITGEIKSESLSINEGDAAYDAIPVRIEATMSMYGVGLGYEKPLINDEANAVSVFGEARFYNANFSVDSSDVFGMQVNVSATGIAYEVEGGARARKGGFLSEISLGWNAVDIDDETGNNVTLDAMVGYQFTDSVYAAIDTSSILDFDYMNVGAKVGFRW